MLFVYLYHSDLWKNDLYFSPAVLKSDWLSINCADFSTNRTVCVMPK